MRVFLAAMACVCAFSCSITLADAHARHYRHHHHAVRHLHAPQREISEAAADHSGLGNIAGMNANFVRDLSGAFHAMPSGASCHVGSGFRSHAEQARLHAEKPNLAAAPGHSNHERGLAADLQCSGGGLHWMHAHASEYGMRFPMSYEDWHIEPIGATRYASHHHPHYARHHYRHYAKG